MIENVLKIKHAAKVVFSCLLSFALAWMLLPIQSSFADEGQDVGLSEEGTVIDDGVQNAEPEGEEDAQTELDTEAIEEDAAIAPLGYTGDFVGVSPMSIGDTFTDSFLEFEVIAEQGSDFQVKVVGYVGSGGIVNVPKEVTSNPFNPGVSYIITAIELGSGGSDARNLITYLDFTEKGSITRIDVTGCIALETLVCRSNMLTSITLPTNASNKLGHLDLTGNQLTNIDVSNNVNLTYLSVAYNSFTSIDISKNEALLDFHCTTNKLTSLDLSKNTNLFSLWVSQNSLTNLDTLNSDDLELLECNNNFLTSLDLSKAPALRYLECINNQLKKLDVSQHSSMIHLLCDSNNLFDINGLANCASLIDFSAINQNVECVMVSAVDGNHISKEKGLLDAVSTFSGPTGFTHDSASHVFKAPSGTTYPASGSFTTTQGAYAVSGTVTFIFEEAPKTQPVSQAASSTGLAATGDSLFAIIGSGLGLLALSVLLIRALRVRSENQSVK